MFYSSCLKVQYAGHSLCGPLAALVKLSQSDLNWHNRYHVRQCNCRLYPRRCSITFYWQYSVTFNLWLLIALSPNLKTRSDTRFSTTIILNKIFSCELLLQRMLLFFSHKQLRLDNNSPDKSYSSDCIFEYYDYLLQ